MQAAPAITRAGRNSFGIGHGNPASAVRPQRDSRLVHEITDYIFLKEDLEKVDVAICLGCTAYTKPVREGIRLYLAGRCNKLLLTGGENTRLRGNEAMLMAGIALAAGVPSRDLIVDPCASNTLENCKNAIDLIRRHQGDPSLPRRNRPKTGLVTIHFHSRRALETFRWASDEEHHPVMIPYDSAYYSSLDWLQSERGRRDVIGELTRMEAYLPVGFSPELHDLMAKLRGCSAPSAEPHR